MTPKEKSQELFDKYIYYVEAFDEISQVKNAKWCALFAVNEILKAIDWHEFEYPNEEIDFWIEVKQELEKL